MAHSAKMVYTHKKTSSEKAKSERVRKKKKKSYLKKKPQYSVDPWTGRKIHRKKKKKKEKAGSIAKISAIAPVPVFTPPPIVAKSRFIDSIGDLAHFVPDIPIQGRDPIDTMKKHFIAYGAQPLRFHYINGTLSVTLNKFLGGGAYGNVFSGSYGNIKEEVAIKINSRNAIGRIAPAAEGGEIFANESGFNEFVNEYNTMAQLNCGVDDPNICAYAVLAIVIDNTMYGCMVMEKMDANAGDFIRGDGIDWIDSREKFYEYKSAILLKAIKNICKLHDMGLFHMDAHQENWFIRYKYDDKYAKPLDMNFQVKMGDMGMACTAAQSIYTHTVKCMDRSNKFTYKKGVDFRYFHKYAGLIEYIQFMKLVMKIIPMTDIETLCGRDKDLNFEKMEQKYDEAVMLHRVSFRKEGFDDIATSIHTSSLKNQTFDYLFFDRRYSVGWFFQQAALKGLMGDPATLIKQGLVPYYNPS